MDAIDDQIDRRGIMLVLSAASGAGKSTLARRLLSEVPGVSLSVSVTTRAPRPGEEDGVHYHFIDQDTFERMAAADELLEFAHVLGRPYGYGTPRQAVEAQLCVGVDILFDIDWQGYQQLRAKAPHDVVGVYVLPPSIGALQERLTARGTEASDEVDQRMRAAQAELERWTEFDYVVVNDDLDATFERLKAILTAERLKRERRSGLATLMDQMFADLGARGFS